VRKCHNFYPNFELSFNFVKILNLQPSLVRYLLERHYEMKPRQNLQLNIKKKTVPMPLIPEIVDHQYAAPAQRVEQKKLDCSKETAGSSKEKSRPEMRDVGVQVNLPPYGPQTDQAHLVDQSNVFDTETFFLKW
jgi:hypothetical protein